MVSFKRFYGRLGNQLFQYAFLRTTAQRLGVKFYCPEWLGDSVFLLNDDNERAKEAVNITKFYREPLDNCGFNESALGIEDGTDIAGYFQSEKYFDREKVSKWYTFKEEKISSLREKYKHIDFSKSVGMHLRFGDKKDDPMYVIMPVKYYKKALSMVKYKEIILVFSDEIEKAKEYLKNIRGNLVYMEGNKNYEDLYLMTLCHDFICSISTLSWWGAWLINYPNKIVVTPKELIRPGHWMRNDDLCCKGWVSLRTCRYLFDDYRFIKAKRRTFRENLLSLKRFLKNKCIAN